jgi:hypothetical protein
MMTVKKLINLLKHMDQDSIVVLTSNAEANEFSPLYDVDEMKYVAETTTSGRVYELEELDEDDNDSEDAVVLWP